MKTNHTQFPEQDAEQPRRGPRGRGPGGFRAHHHAGRGRHGFGAEAFGPAAFGPESGFGPGGHGHRPGAGGFGPGGFGSGPFARGAFGPRGFGGGSRGRRARKGDVRAAILSLLANGPANGYALIQAISEQSDGAWKPSPGSVYPTLAQLVDEDLITPVDTQAPRSDYRLTDAGQAYVTEHADELAAIWEGLEDHGPHGTTGELFQATGKLLGVLRQYASEATEEQQREAVGKLDDLRRQLYRTLGE